MNDILTAKVATNIFVAITDEIMYENPEKIDGPLVPYSTSMECHHWLDIEINPTDLAPLNSDSHIAA